MLLRVFTVLCVLAGSGCSYQLRLGAARSPDNQWSGSFGMSAGFEFDVTDAFALGAAGDFAISGYGNRDGGGYAISGPTMASARYRLLHNARRALAVVGEITHPFGYVSFTPEGSDQPDGLPDGRAVRGLAGIEYQSVSRKQVGHRVELRIGLAAESMIVYGPGFDDVATVGPVVTLGMFGNYRAMGHALECMLEKDDYTGC